MKRLLRKISAPVRWARSYKLLAFAIVAALAAGALYLLHHNDLAEWILRVAAVVAIIPVVVRIVRDLQSGRYGVDMLALLAIVTSLVLQQNWAAIVIVIMLASGTSLEDFARSRARTELKDLLKRSPQHAHVVVKGKETDVLARVVREGDHVVVRPGEIVPVDGVIIDGESSFNESSLTGESLPLTKNVGDTVLSGSVNGDGVVVLRATHTAADSQYQQIVRLVQSAGEHPAPYVRLADRYSIPFTVAALSIGGIAWILSHEAIRFLDVLVVATPCPLILAAPTALIAGMSRAARDGIIVKTGTALELLAGAKTFAFDKTGTLTYGRPELDEIVAFKAYKKTEVLAWAAALEQHSNHVLGSAICAAAGKQALKLPKIKHISEHVGRGLAAHAQGKDVLVGRFSFLRDQDVVTPSDFDPVSVQQTATYVAVDGTMIGYLTFRDNIRESAKPTIAQLRQLGVQKFIMVTGDHSATAKTVAKQLGITEVAAEMLPGEKLQAIEKVEKRPVAFVGDGVNDAPVLMAADVGIALGARGSTAASESADVVIMKDELSDVARAMAIAKRAFHIANQSILVGIGVSLALMVVFAFGKFSPITGAVAQEGLDIIVILNALRAHAARSPSQSTAKDSN